MVLKIFSFAILLLLCGCAQNKDRKYDRAPHTDTVQIDHARGFSISHHDGYKLIAVSDPWPDADHTFHYVLAEKGVDIPDSVVVDAVVRLPVERLVVTSTTHIPSLEMLGVEEKLAGFPGLDLISSPKTRTLIDRGGIRELGRNEVLNTEAVLDLQPDVVIGFAVEGDNKAFRTLEKAGIPVVYNSDWMETSPLGKAEWLRFFAAFFDREAVADSIFGEIESGYNKTKALAFEQKHRPSVFSGAMWKDIWYMPEGKSWAARFISDANGQYLWGESPGSGSLALNLESVLDRAQSADYWIGPAQYTSLEQLEKAHPAYPRFEAFRQKRVYSFSAKKGEGGGLLYYELAPNRPDLVLKDLVRILHPELLPEHALYFFTKLE